MRKLVAAGALTASVTGAAVALAAGPPSASTGAATGVTDTSATLNATVFPNQNATSYHFEYGTSTGYGAQTPSQGPIGGNAGKNVSAALTGLAPSTEYHYRVVATNSAGGAVGNDATFSTLAPGAAPPSSQNAVTIAAAPAIVRFGKATAITGQLTGAGNAGVKVTLEANPFPFTGGFKDTPLTTVTDGAGNYAFSATPGANIHYRVSAKASPTVTSPEAAVGVRVKVGLRLSDATPAAGRRIRLSGKVLPAHDGTKAKIQRRIGKGHWRTIATRVLKSAKPVAGVAASRYSKRVRVGRTAAYRVRVTPTDGDHARGTSRKRKARVH